MRNYSMNRSRSYDETFMAKVYGWMTLALAATGFVAMYVANTPSLIQAVAGSTWSLIGIVIVELALVMFLVWQIDNLSFSTAFFLFFLYAAVSGLTFSVIFLVYTESSIALTFFVTAGTFAAMSIYGLTTKKDLSSWGSILFMMLLGLIIAMIANMFIGSSTMSYIISFIGVIVFVLYTAYDTQKIKEMSYAGDQKAALLGALTLYLDFVNLFLNLLRLLGGSKD